MGRSQNGTRKPFRFLLNRSAATAPNVYLMLYPVPSLSKLLKAKPGLHQAVWESLNQIPVDALVGAGRMYGDGLYKTEPKELGNAPAEGVIAAVGAGSVGRGRQKLLFQ
jgi:adenine-specific DNA-methyltransferase